MCWTDGDCSEVWNERQIRAARKTHRCESGCRIEPGQPYTSIFSIFEGDASTYKICPDCVALQKAMSRACRLYEPHSADAPLWDLKNEAREHLQFEFPDEVPAEIRAEIQAMYDALCARTPA